MRRIKYLILGVGLLAQVVSYSQYAGVGIDHKILAGDTATNDLISNLWVSGSMKISFFAIRQGRNKDIPSGRDTLT